MEPKTLKLANDILGLIFLLAANISVICLLVVKDPIYIAIFLVSLSLSNLLFVLKPFVKMNEAQSNSRRYHFLNEESSVIGLTGLLLGGYACYVQSWVLMIAFFSLYFIKCALPFIAGYFNPSGEDPNLAPAPDHPNCGCSEEPTYDTGIEYCDDCSEKETCKERLEMVENGSGG